MSDLVFILQILFSVTALCSAYVFIMNITKKPPNVVWGRGSAVLTLASAGVSFGFSFLFLFGSENIFEVLSVLFLTIGVANALAVVSVHRFEMNDDVEYRPEILSIVRTLMIITAVTLLLHIVLQLAALSGL